MRILICISQMLIFGIFCSAEAIYANESDMSVATLEKLMTARKSIKETSAAFTEDKKVSALKEILHMQGTLLYRSPNYLLKIYTSPERISYEATNDSILIKNLDGNSEEEEQIIGIDRIPVLHAFIAGLRGILGGNIKDVREFFQVDFSASAQNWSIKLIPKDDETRKQISELIIRGKNEQVLNIEINENSGDSSITTIMPYNTINTLMY